jgi:hypothetical protein
LCQHLQVEQQQQQWRHGSQLQLAAVWKLLLLLLVVVRLQSSQVVQVGTLVCMGLGLALQWYWMGTWVPLAASRTVQVP